MIKPITTGDPDGRGTARLTLDGQAGEICFEITVADIEPAFAAPIHEGASNVEGPVVVSLAPPSDGFAMGCASAASADLIASIRENPGAYYVNVHNAPYPAGALARAVRPLIGAAALTSVSHCCIIV